jgi:hypothetical protein
VSGKVWEVHSVPFFSFSNIGTGTAKEIYGTVRNVGMDTGTVFTLPRVVATVETEDGKVVSVEIPVMANVTKESKLILGKRLKGSVPNGTYSSLNVGRVSVICVTRQTLRSNT